MGFLRLVLAAGVFCASSAAIDTQRPCELSYTAKVDSFAPKPVISFVDGSSAFG